MYNGSPILYKAYIQKCVILELEIVATGGGGGGGGERGRKKGGEQEKRKVKGDPTGN